MRSLAWKATWIGFLALLAVLFHSTARSVWLGVARPDVLLVSLTNGVIVLAPLALWTVALTAYRFGGASKLWAWGAWGVSLAYLALGLNAEWARIGPYVASLGVDIVPHLDLALIASSLPVAGAWKLTRAVQPAALSLDTSDKVHGAADFLDMKRARSLLSADGGIVLGEAYRVDHDRVAGVAFDPRKKGTWGKGGSQPILAHDGVSGTGSGHFIQFAGSGGLKTVANGVPSALRWCTSLVYLDPSTEVLPMVRGAREAMGHRVFALNPSDPGTDALNPLDWIDPTTPSSVSDIHAVVAQLADGDLGGKPGDDYFFRAGKRLIAVVLAYVLYEPRMDDGARTLRKVYELVSLPSDKLRKLLETIHGKGRGFGFGFPAPEAGKLAGITPKQFDGIHDEAATILQWLADPTLAALVSGSDFRTADITDGRTDVFVNVPLKTLQASPGLARFVLGAFLQAHIEADGRIGGRTLFLLDECYQLGGFRTLEVARDNGRKYGVNLVLLYQAYGQLERSWGPEGAKAWMANAQGASFAAVSDHETAELVSAMCGDTTVVASSASNAEGGARDALDVLGSVNRSVGLSTSQAARRLIKPDEVRTMRADEQIVFLRGEAPLRCGRAIYFRRPDMVRAVEANRFANANDPKSGPTAPRFPLSETDAAKRLRTAIDKAA